MIKDTVDQMLKANSKNPCKLEGGAFCASFEVEPNGEPWIQAKDGALNIYYPFDSPPNILLPELSLDELPSIAFPAWQENKFATIAFDSISVDDLTNYIDRLFQKLYNLPEDYIVNTEVFDMR